MSLPPGAAVWQYGTEPLPLCPVERPGPGGVLILVQIRQTLVSQFAQINGLSLQLDIVGLRRLLVSKVRGLDIHLNRDPHLCVAVLDPHKKRRHAGLKR